MRYQVERSKSNIIVMRSKLCLRDENSLLLAPHEKLS